MWSKKKRAVLGRGQCEARDNREGSRERGEDSTAKHDSSLAPPDVRRCLTETLHTRRH